jgi:hydroxymethylpyrimidine/phosphomethylpyrimidine kinase
VTVYRALTIAGSDSGGGAGIQADLKTFHQFEVYGASAITLVTAQNTLGVRGIEVLSPAVVVQQIDAVLDDIGADAVKTGALGSVPVIEAVSSALARHGVVNIVVDPVMVSKHGDELLGDDAVDALKRVLLPCATLVTPNLPEASALTGHAINSELDMMEAARMILSMGPGAVVIKGGQRLGTEAVDIFFDGSQVLRLPAPAIDTPHTHGSGCTYSAAITALLARGETLERAVRDAKAFMSLAIASAPGIGGGHGPVNHWARAQGVGN